MWGHAHQMAAAGIPFIFDPGQQLPLFNGDELRAVLKLASWVALNDYEAAMVCDRMGLSLAEISRLGLQGVVVTLGAEGCELWIDGVRTHVPGEQATAVVDPTGCGDAFRAALLFGLERGWSLERCVRLGNHIGALKIACRGGQNHVVDRAVLQRL
jgi:adenosine kinase